MTVKRRLSSLLVIGICVTACSTPDQKPDHSNLTLCPKERPQICTREYNPVCATLIDTSQGTYATGCTACSDGKVIGYEMGKCE